MNFIYIPGDSKNFLVLYDIKQDFKQINFANIE